MLLSGHPLQINPCGLIDTISPRLVRAAWSLKGYVWRHAGCLSIYGPLALFGQKEPGVSTTDPDARAIKMRMAASGPPTTARSERWLKARSWLTPAATLLGAGAARSGTRAILMPAEQGRAGVAEWRWRMRSPRGKGVSTTGMGECIHFRQWGLRQFIVRGVHKVGNRLESSWEGPIMEHCWLAPPRLFVPLTASGPCTVNLVLPSRRFYSG